MTLGPAGVLRYVKYLVFTATSRAQTTGDDRRVDPDPVREEDILVGGQAVFEGVMMPMNAGIAYEIIRYSARRPGALARGIMALGDALAVEETGRT